MQFNPPCQQAGGSMSNEFINSTNQTYSDGPPTNNSWSQGSVLNLPVYGIYNASLIPVPEATPNQASDTSIPASKKKNSKRSPQSKVDPNNMGLDEANDKYAGLDEEQKLKRQRRLVKNREAAQQFRQRQKEYIQNLERRVTELNGHVSDTHKHVELLTAENRLLRDQLVYLYNVMRQNLSLTGASPISPNGSYTAAMGGSVPPSPSVPPTPPPSPIGGFPNGMNLGTTAVGSSLSPPSQMLDLSMLGFKGYNVLDGSAQYDIMKNNPQIQLQNLPPTIQLPQNLQNIQSLQSLQQMQNLHNLQQSLQQQGTPIQTPTTSPVPTPSASPTHLGNMPDLGTLKLDMESTMLMSRFSKADPNEAQTVPVFTVKPETGGASL